MQGGEKVTRKVFLVLLALVIALSVGLVACGGTGQEEEEEEEPEGLILEPGGLVTGVDGVTVGAPEGVLEQAIEIYIEKMDDPRGEVPFPEYMEDMEIVGDFYEISAGQNFTTSAGDYLLLGLPVPEGVSTNDLIFVSLVPPDGIIRGWPDDDPSQRWGPLQGVYDPGSGLLCTLLPSVSAGSDLFGLGELSQTVEITHTDIGRFRVVSFETEIFKSPETHRVMTVDALAFALWAYGEWGFVEPDLRHVASDIDLFPEPHITLEDLYEYWLIWGSPNGYYKPSSRTAATVYWGAPDQPDSFTAYHELHHGIQFAYFSLRGNYYSSKQKMWEVRRTIDAAATAAEMSLAWLTRSSDPGSSRDPHTVDHGLWSSTEVSGWDYRAQDFVVYLCKRAQLGQGLGWLSYWYSAGGLEEDLDYALQIHHSLNSLGEAYWEWVKNQAFEKSVPLGLDSGGQLVPHGDTCSWSGHGQPHGVYYSPADDSWGGDVTDFKLPRLTSRVFHIQLPPTGSPYEVTAKIYTDDPHIRWKFYEDDQAGTDQCWSCCENSMQMFQVTNTYVSAYLLVSNTDWEGQESGSISLGSVLYPVWGDRDLAELIGTIIGARWDQIDASDLAGLVELDGSGREISDLGGLEYCTNLEDLDLGDNQISDISPLANLTSLEGLSLDWNQISDLSPLANLTSLTMLNLDENQISDLDPLADLTGLTVLGANYNEITDLGPLANLTGLEQLRLYGNQIRDVSIITDLGNLQYLDLGANQISDISPLVDNEGLSGGDQVYLNGNPLSSDSVNIYIPQLVARGVIVDY